MEEEIDLRPYFEALIQNWKWIVGAAVLAGLVAFGVSFLLPPTYEATALVTVTEPGQIVQFDPRFEAIAENQPLKAFPELATSDELLQALFEEIGDEAPEIETLEGLRNRVEAAAGADPSIIRLTVSYGDPGVTAVIANTWAELFVTKANEIFGDQGGDQVRFYEAQLAAAESELTTAEQALIEFQARNRAGVLNNQLNALQQTQSSYLNTQRNLSFLLNDVTALRDQFDQQTGSQVTLADQLTALSLQLKTFNAESSSQMQLQIDPAENLTTEDRQDQVASLAALVATIETRQAQIESILTDLEPTILAVQEEKQIVETESNRLSRNYTVAEETYTALARKLEEERITSQDTSRGVRLASKTAVPENPVSPRKLINTVVAGFLGLFLGIAFVLIIKWWDQNEDLADGEPSESMN